MRFIRSADNRKLLSGREALVAVLVIETDAE
jgi:hypothetical protein